MLDRIRVDPGVCEGRPTVRGLRITVEFVLKLLGDGYTAADIVREYPELEEEDVYQAARYGAWLEDPVRAGAIVAVQDAAVRVRSLPLR